MRGLLFGLVLGVAITCVALVALTRSSDGCIGRCGAGTTCRDHRCEPIAPVVATVAAAPPSKEKRRHGHRGGDPSAAPEIVLHPGDEKMVVQGDALGRPERIDLTEAGSDGRELTEEDLDRIVHGAEPAITRCITTAVGDAPLETGKVEVGLRVEKSGQVSRVRVEGPAIMQRQGLSRCIRAVVIALHFPASGGATVATYPYQLK